MTKIERKFFDFIRNHLFLILFICITVIALLLRLRGLDYQSDDFRRYLKSWWIVIDQQGFAGLKQQVGNYNIPYQILIVFLTKLKLDALFAYKIISIIFDYVLAISAALLVKQFRNEKFFDFSPVVTYCMVLCSTTVIFNSAFWGQCDGIYTAFILFAIYFINKEKNIPAFIFLGLAFAFKLQMIFIVPLFLYYYATTRKCSILHFFIIPLTDIVLCLPAIFMGRPFLDIFNIYVGQTDEGKQLQMNFPNFYAFFTDGNKRAPYDLLRDFTIYLAIAVLLAGLALMLYKKVDLSNRENFLLTGVWSVFTCLMFLSSMHERYGYLLDILVIVYAIAVRKHFIVAILCNLISLRGYGYYIFENYEALTIGQASMVYLGVYFYVTYLFIREVCFGKKEPLRLMHEGRRA